MLPTASPTPWTPVFSRDEVLARTGCLVPVRNTSFDVLEGESFVIMGLSGSGKSTVIRCLSRLVQPTKVRHPDRWPGPARNEQAAASGRPPLQNGHGLPALRQFPHKRVLDNVVYGLRIQGADRAAQRQRAPEVIELVGLSGCEDRYPRRLIGLQELMRKTMVFITHDFF